MNVTSKKDGKRVTLSKYTEMAQSAIAKLVGINQNTVSCIVEKAADTENLTLRWRVDCGRKRKITVSCCNTIKGSKKMSSVAVKNELALGGVQVLFSTERSWKIVVGLESP